MDETLPQIARMNRNSAVCHRAEKSQPIRHRILQEATEATEEMTFPLITQLKLRSRFYRMPQRAQRTLSVLSSLW
jgi:hypothetical protein